MKNNENELYKEETTEVVTEYTDNDTDVVDNKDDIDIEYKNILDNMIKEFSLDEFISDQSYNIEYYQILSKVMINEYKNTKDSMKNYKIASSIFLILFVISMILIMILTIITEVI